MSINICFDSGKPKESLVIHNCHPNILNYVFFQFMFPGYFPRGRTYLRGPDLTKVFSRGEEKDAVS